MSAVVRIAVPRDTKSIREVYYKTWLATYPNEEHKILLADIELRFRDVFTPESIKKGERRIAYLPSYQQMFVAEKDGTVVGVADVKKEEEANSIGTLYVLPEYQCEGVGKLLFIASLAWLESDKDIIVDVAVYNLSAIKFFESFGFKVTPEILQKEVFRMPSGSIITEQRMRREAKYFQDKETPPE